MKINEITPNQNLPGQNQVRQPDSGGGNFAEILQTHLQGSEAVGQLSTSHQVSASAAIPAQLRVEGLGLSESAINTLDSFSAALADPELKSSELEPYISALEEESAALTALRDDLPAEDPLSRLLNEVAAVSQLEVAKYRRGDY
ncbi:MAG: hypothetical protein U5J62_00900 [Desulfurivibrio sp.]|nr:hypothetical protein [Desulfurivibrio sp.]